MKMPEHIDDFFLAPCGVNCFVCYVHLKDKLPCNGCNGLDTDKPERCRKCKIQHCVFSKSIKYCYECDEYPCKRIRNLDKSYKNRYNVSLIENFEFVKNNGLNAFLNSEQNKWICHVCGGVITQHGHYCSECERN